MDHFLPLVDKMRQPYPVTIACGHWRDIYHAMFLALLLLSVIPGNDLATRLKAVLNAMTVTGRLLFFTRFEWLWNTKISPGYFSRLRSIIAIAGGLNSTRRAFRRPCSRISIESTSISSYRSPSNLPTLWFV